MEVRLLLAFLLMGAVMFLTPYLFKTQPPAPVKKAEQTTTAPAPVAKPPETAPAPSSAPETVKASAAAPVTPKITGPPLPPFVIDTDLFRVTFSNQGANVRSWHPEESQGQRQQAARTDEPRRRLGYPFSLYFPARSPPRT